MLDKKGQTSPGWILILIFIFIMAGTIGIILYNQTKIYEIRINITDNNIPKINYTENNLSTVKETPIINISENRWQNNTNITSIQ